MVISLRENKEIQKHSIRWEDVNKTLLYKSPSMKEELAVVPEKIISLLYSHKNISPSREGVKELFGLVLNSYTDSAYMIRAVAKHDAEVASKLITAYDQDSKFGFSGPAVASAAIFDASLIIAGNDYLLGENQKDNIQNLARNIELEIETNPFFKNLIHTLGPMSLTHYADVIGSIRENAGPQDNDFYTIQAGVTIPVELVSRKFEQDSNFQPLVFKAANPIHHDVILNSENQKVFLQIPSKNQYIVPKNDFNKFITYIEINPPVAEIWSKMERYYEQIQNNEAIIKDKKPFLKLFDTFEENYKQAHSSLVIGPTGTFTEQQIVNNSHLNSNSNIQNNYLNLFKKEDVINLIPSRTESPAFNSYLEEISKAIEANSTFLLQSSDKASSKILKEGIEVIETYLKSKNYTSQLEANGQVGRWFPLGETPAFINKVAPDLNIPFVEETKSVTIQEGEIITQGNQQKQQLIEIEKRELKINGPNINL